MGSTHPKVTVVLPTRNRLAFLIQALSSIQRLAFSSWECVVVDDGSTDKTPSFLSDLRDPRIRVVELERHSGRSLRESRARGSSR